MLGTKCVKNVSGCNGGKMWGKKYILTRVQIVALFEKNLKKFSFNFFTKKMTESGTPIVTHKCSFCGVAAKNRCARCQAAHYCSATCQKEDWNNGHKVICKPNYKPTYVTPNDEARCKTCKGWGKDLLGEDGMCAHCRRIAAGETVSVPE